MSDEAQTTDSETVFLETLSLGVLSLDMYAQYALKESEANLIAALHTQLQELWPAFWQEIIKANIPQELGLKLEKEQQWEAELCLIDNEHIQQLNQEYRHKDQSTDVLTFCALADHDSSMTDTLLMLPVISLGSVFVSIPWAKDAVQEFPETLQAYLLERIFHGFLHLLGAHHDTMADYERIKGIQDRVISKLTFD